MPPKNVITNPWDTSYVHLIGPCTLKGKDGSVLDCMCLTMIDPATSCFEMVELPVIEIFKTYGDDAKTAETFDTRLLCK